MRQGAWGWCTGMTLRDGMGREVGGGSGWGTHVYPWLIHVNVNIVKSNLSPIKINKLTLNKRKKEKKLYISMK